MGKSWRKKDRSPVPVHDGPADYKWSSQSYTLKDILTNFKLPVVVQCRQDTNPEHLQNFFFELHQPILLHSRRTSRKVFARCVRKNEGGTIKELLPEVVIPEDYQGWFKISKGLEFAKPTPHRSIETLTRSNAEFFLCTTEFDAIVMTESPDADVTSSDSFSRPVVEGEVLRKTGIQKLNRLLLPEPERSSTGDNRYLMCIDEKDCELFVPVSQTGLFYEVSDGNFDKNDNCVVQISDILDEMLELPLYVRHILGDPPPISKFYSPQLKLMRVQEEETVMGSTLDTEEEALPLEVQTDSDIKFEIALNTPMLQSCNEYIEAFDMCNSVSQTYVSDMKLAVNFKLATIDEDINEPKVQAGDMVTHEDPETQESISNSQRTSTYKGSDIGEVEANSEFSIQWEPIPSVRNTPEDQSERHVTDEDCDSIASVSESVDSVQAVRLNSVLGGPFFETEHKLNEPDSETVINNNVHKRSNSDPDNMSRIVPLLNLNEGFIMKPSDRISPRRKIPAEVQAAVTDDIVEEVTDFSMRKVPRLNIGRVRTSSPNVLPCPGSFTDSLNSLPSSVTVTSLNKLSSRSTVITDPGGQVDLCENLPSSQRSNMLSLPRTLANTLSLQKSLDSSLTPISDPSMQLSSVPSNLSSARSGPSTASNLSLHVHSLERTDGQPHMPYVYTGDVYISPDSKESLNSFSTLIGSNDSMPESLASFDSSHFRQLRHRELTPASGRIHPTPDVAQKVERLGSLSLSDDLIRFDEPSRTPSANSIITCKVADEMVTSCNDLRLSLQEITRNARDSQIENSWREFCLERSSSLPVRSKISPRKNHPSDEHSKSWEQLSPRRHDSITNSRRNRRSKRSHAPTKTLNKLNIDIDSIHGDKTQLILDTSSEDSAQFSHRGLDEDDNNSSLADTSFTQSEISDMSVQDGEDMLLAAIEEIEAPVCLNRSLSDTSVTDASTLTRDKAALTHKIKIRREIKRKQRAEWNDIVEVI